MRASIALRWHGCSKRGRKWMPKLSVHRAVLHRWHCITFDTKHNSVYNVINETVDIVFSSNISNLHHQFLYTGDDNIYHDINNRIFDDNAIFNTKHQHDNC